MIVDTTPKDQTVSYIAGEDLLAGDCVFLAHETAPYTFIDQIVPGRVYKTKKDIRFRGANANTVGIVTTSASNGSTVVIQVLGLASGLSGLTGGRTYEAGATAGALEAFDGNRVTAATILGIAVSETSLLLLPQRRDIRNRTYPGGGFSAAVTNTIDVISFSTETRLTTSTLVVTRGNIGGAFSSLRGYYFGGNNGGYRNTIDAILFSSETCTTLSATLSVAVYGAGGLCYTTTAYSPGGYNGSVSRNTIDALTFSSETRSSLSATLTLARERISEGSAPTKAYMSSGTVNNSTSNTVIDTLAFSSETCQVSSAITSVGRAKSAGVSARTKCYMMGGGNTSIDCLTFGTETQTTLSATISTSKAQCGHASSSIAGYELGGHDGSNRNTIDRLFFSSETDALLTTVLSTARHGIGGVSS